MWVITKTALLIGLFLLAPYTVRAMELWPESFDVRIEAGVEGRAELVLVNDGAESSQYRVDLLQVHFGETREELSFSSLDDQTASWIRLDDDTLSLAANTQGTIGLTFVPPADLSSRVVAIGIQVEQQLPSTSDIAVQTAVISLGFVTVGSPDGDYEWLDVTIETGAGWSLPVTSSLHVRNKGERVVIPQGTMRITSLFGREIATVSFNEAGSRVPSGQVRTLTTHWGNAQEEKPFIIGIFAVDLEIFPWESGDVFYARQHIVLFPWKGVLIVIFITACLSWVHRFSRRSSV